MKKDFKRYDLSEKPKKNAFWIKPLRGFYSIGKIKSHKEVITKVDMEGIKPPFLVLGNHNAYLDIQAAVYVLGNVNTNYVAAIDGQMKRKWQFKALGNIVTRKFVNDPYLVWHLKHVINMGCVAVMYPEARYSLCGTTAVLPESVGFLCKFLKVPVVTIMSHGHHINHPFWNTSHDRKVKGCETELKLLFTAEDVKKMSVDELNEKIVERFQYDDFAWQKEKGIKVTNPKRAEELHRVLYKCPHCGKEFQMESKGIELHCKACDKRWEMTELGELRALNGETEYSHIPDWYEWERACVKKEIEEGTYSSGVLNVNVETFPDDRFFKLGKGTMVHDMNGFHVKGIDVDGDPFELEKPVPSLYSCHVEYQYLFKHGDCVDLNTVDDTWYIFPDGDQFSVTKMALATEELYFDHLRKQGKPIKKGLA